MDIISSSGLKPVPVIELISPPDAEKMLGTMATNRTVSESKMWEYAFIMDKGGWVLNGETIKFDQFGRLFDGQHRLRACIAAGKPFRSYVVRGIDDPRAFATVDVGKNRTAGDVFHIAGFASGNEVAAAAALVYLFKQEKLDWRGLRRGKKENNKLEKKMAIGSPKYIAPVSKDALLEFAGGIADGLASAVRSVKQIGIQKNRMMGAGLAAGLYYLFREKSFDDAERFFKDLKDGANLTTHDPVYHLREHLILNRSELKRLSRWAIIGYSLKCWNKRRSGEQMRYLRVVDGEAYPRKLL